MLYLCLTLLTTHGKLVVVQSLLEVRQPTDTELQPSLSLSWFDVGIELYNRPYTIADAHFIPADRMLELLP
ncbi:hypothetical protein BDQ12DRAFT_688910 [Crucibulum laeve]|uniref:Uncharacterized protein n=1 Tax=Crucibulum laeve TaxID=68775 RepID=A0A5C3LR68_9AGAR|nr:hypothetical protein BDQ12DRAFT_688910 [Crucibulum laeve]